MPCTLQIFTLKVGQCHLLDDIRLLDHLLELLERDLAITVQVRLDHGLVDNLLELGLFQVAAHHHLEHDEEFAVGDEAITVNVVHFEGD